MTNYNVTAIKQEKNENYCLTIQTSDEIQEMFVDASVLVSINLLSPRILTQEEYDSLYELHVISSGYQKAIQYISYRKRSKKEVEKYLRDKQEIDAEDSRTIIKKLEQQNYINDKDFIGSYIRDAFITSVKGPRKIRFELLNKFGCLETDVDAVLPHEYTMQDEQKQAKCFVEKMLRKKYASEQQAHHKISQKGFEMGYSNEVIQSLLQESHIEIKKDFVKLQRILQREYQKALQKELNAYETKQQIIQKLCQQQVSYDEAIELVDSYLHEQV